MNKPIDVKGKRFGYLQVIDKRQNGWYCTCDCGNSKIISSVSALKKGKITSCGCYKKGKDHGLSQTKIYRVWSAIKARCNNPNTKSYKDYGLKGIKMCDEWANSPTNFYDWCLKNDYQEGLEIDRIDFNGSYNPENCRFVTKDVNAVNKADIVHLTINGETKMLKEWSEITGLKYQTIYARYKKGYKDEELIQGLHGGKKI